MKKVMFCILALAYVAAFTAGVGGQGTDAGHNT